MKELTKGPNLGTLLQQFFVEYMMQQRHASPRTIAAYRDSFPNAFQLHAGPAR